MIALTGELRRLALEVETTRALGLALGLDAAAVDETVRAWTDRHAARLDPVEWLEVRGSLALRAAGAEWRPPA